MNLLLPTDFNTDFFPVGKKVVKKIDDVVQQGVHIMSQKRSIISTQRMQTPQRWNPRMDP